MRCPSSVSEDLDRLCQWVRDLGSAIVAYSGGVDSAVVLAAAHRSLGERAMGCIGVSPSYPQRELETALRLAGQIGATVRIVHTQEHLDPRYAANAANRCYFCKSDLYSRLRSVAAQEGFAGLLDGTNTSDFSEHRFGYDAAKDHGVRSPLAELGFDKSRVRQLARTMELSVWDKPATPCLASRVPHGTAIDPEILRQIERAETVLADLGFSEFRVRHHGELARIELPPAEITNAIACRQTIVVRLRGAGYRHVTLDLSGFRGSLNVLPATDVVHSR